MSQVDRFLLPRGVTAGQLIAQLAELDPEDRLVCGDDGITLLWLRVASLDEGRSGPDPVAEALAVPHLPAIARKLRHLPDPPGRPRILDAATALRLDVKSPAAARIASTLAALPWPPEWLPAPAIESGR